MSKAQRQPARLINSSKPLSLWVRLAWFATVVLVWWFVAREKLVSTLIVPPPLTVLQSARDIGADLFLHIFMTFARSLGGFAAGAVLGVVLGALVQYSRVAQIVAEPALDSSRPVPALALLPFFILIFGFSETGRLTLIILNVMVFISLATMEAIAKVPESWVRFARVAGVSKSRIFTQILLPGAVPWLTGPLRLALALSFTLAIAAEFMGSQHGLGFLINTARVNLATPTIWLSIILLGLGCQLADRGLVSVCSRLSSWYQTSD